MPGGGGSVFLSWTCSLDCWLWHLSVFFPNDLNVNLQLATVRTALIRVFMAMLSSVVLL